VRSLASSLAVVFDPAYQEPQALSGRLALVEPDAPGAAR